VHEILDVQFIDAAVAAVSVDDDVVRVARIELHHEPGAIPVRSAPGVVVVAGDVIPVDVLVLVDEDLGVVLRGAQVDDNRAGVLALVAVDDVRRG
jgi:hypothetical protein